MVQSVRNIAYLLTGKVRNNTWAIFLMVHPERLGNPSDVGKPKIQIEY